MGSAPKQVRHLVCPAILAAAGGELTGREVLQAIADGRLPEPPMANLIGARLADEFALESHRRAVSAQESGAFDAETVPVVVSTRKNGDVTITKDEHPRADTSLEKLAKMRPVMGRTRGGATVTARNASGQNDGASVCIVTTPEKAAELGLTPMARWSPGPSPASSPSSWASVPCPPRRRHSTAPLTMDDMDLVELNEACLRRAGPWLHARVGLHRRTTSSA